jgi:hypothetical protein
MLLSTILAHQNLGWIAFFKENIHHIHSMVITTTPMVNAIVTFIMLHEFFTLSSKSKPFLLLPSLDGFQILNFFTKIVIIHGFSN